MVSILTFALRSLHSYRLVVYHYTVFIIRKQFFTLAVESNFAMPAQSITFPLCIAPSGPPRGVSAIASDSRTIEISWSQPLLEEHNGIIWSYIVNMNTTETGQYTQNRTTNTVFTAENLHPYYNYNISVAAVTVAMGPFSAALLQQTPQDSK